MPIAMLLHLIGHAQNLGFAEIIANQLHAYRQAVGTKSGG